VKDSIEHSAGQSPASSQRRRLLQTALASAVAGWPTLKAAAQPGAQLRWGYIGTGKVPALASGWAHQRGYLLRELSALGITGISTHAFPNGPDLNEALLGDALDLGIYGDTPAIVARSRSPSSVLIGLENVGMNAWLLTPRNGVKTVAELRNKVVGVALGSYMHRYLLGTLKEAGILGQVRVVYMLGKDAEAALERGDLAAYAAQIELGPLLASRGFPVIDEAQSHPSLRGSSVIVATAKALQRHPQLAVVWHRARRAGLQDMRRDPQAYYGFHARNTGFPLEAVKASYPLEQFAKEPFPAAGLALLGQTHAFLREQNLVRSDVDLAAWRVAGIDADGR
jgi:NitT/TauT family transport system substrate-binding protein/sulfonate transport system substrate-binding protein